ncbi:MFP1 attachment factor 1-like [Typha angustifolia]|uniref:MFP1 attachment factor 1-like n=1 Tax=Typha angustifolia TaxID=59011 RepID=UPI003C2F216B
MAEELEASNPPAGENNAKLEETSGEVAAKPSTASASASASAAGFSLSIWPPSQRTRDAVIRRLVENLTSSTVLSKRYGTVPADEAEESARAIEQEAFAAAAAGVVDGASDNVDEGIEILHVYSKEISRRLLDFAKSRASASSAASSLAAASSGAPSEAAAAEEDSNADTTVEEASAGASESPTV